MLYVVLALRRGCAQEMPANRGGSVRPPKPASPSVQYLNDPAHRLEGPLNRPPLMVPQQSPVNMQNRRPAIIQRRPSIGTAVRKPSQVTRKRPPNYLHLLHIPKTAGATLEHLLGRREERGPNVLKNGSCVFWHTPPRFLKPNQYKRERTFCVVRDPLDRLLSEFKMKHAHALNSSHAAVAFMKSIISSAKKFANPVMVSKNCHLWPQHLYVWDEEGKCTCQHVLRYEKLEKDFDSLMESLGSSFRMKDNPFRQQHHQSSRLTVRDIPADVAKQVRATYSKDMVLLGYGDDHGNYKPWNMSKHISTSPARTCIALGSDAVAVSLSPRNNAAPTEEDQPRPLQNTSSLNVSTASGHGASDVNFSTLASVVVIEAPQTLLWLNESGSDESGNSSGFASSENDAGQLARR